jgi:Flp pilus assembly protein TadG
VTGLLRRHREHRREPRRKPSRGQALVEFALVLPLFLLLLFGLVDVGRVVFINNSLAEAARDGARWGSVQGRSGDVAGRTSIAAATMDRMNGVPAPTVTVICEREGATVTDCHTNDVLVVRAASPVQLVTPVFNGLIGPLNLSATTRVAINQ